MVYFYDVNKIISILLILLVGFSSFGVKIFEHACSMDGVFVSYFRPEKHSCKLEIQKPACCKGSALLEVATKKSFDKKDCCSDAVKVYQWIPVGYSDSENSSVFYSSTFCVLPSLLRIFSPQLTNTIHSNDPQKPPQLAGREILLRKQVLQI